MISSAISSLPYLKNPVKIEALEGGFTNAIYRIDTKHASFIHRTPKEKGDEAKFRKVLELTKKAAAFSLGPKVFGESVPHQEMLLEYIESAPWPTYEIDPQPFEKTMEYLQAYHKRVKEPKTNRFAPFNWIIDESDRLVDMPDEFYAAVLKIKAMQERLRPWLEEHATLCHGDFHKGNVLLKKQRKCFRPYLIDFDSNAIGHPYIDVVKFSVALPQNARMKLFSCYLGKRKPTKEEVQHFEFLDLALLMVITIVRFRSAQKADPILKRLSKEEMEKMLRSKEKLPSFLSINFKDTSPEARQKGALYALAEFMQRFTH